MSRRNSPNDIPDLGELSRLSDFVFDKRQDQRASAKKHRRNRHYEKQFIRNTLARLPQAVRAVVGGLNLSFATDEALPSEDGS